MIDFKNLYNQQDLLSYLNEYLPDFEPQKEKLQLNKKYKYIKSVVQLGKSKELGLNVYEIDHISENDPRVTLSKEAFSILREYIARKSLVVFKNESTQNYRLSLITFQSTWESGNKIKTEFSNPRRYSFFLGPDAKVKTPTRFLIEKGKIVDFEDLKKRFSLEVVNKEFYKDISEQFIKLVGGSLNKGKKKIEYLPLLKLPSISDKSQITVEFAVRLIGRVIFCWFLREKKSLSRRALVPKDLLSYEAIGENADYYHKILEPIFFEVLNKPVRQRREDFVNNLFSSIPYLNGGLFSPHEDDYYRRSNGDFQSQYHNTLIIPDQWFTEFFQVLETYNFTIDENTSFDEELSIDPEMLGRIFENLLAEINPETGESARKSTGSYYTPRVIVDYMVDESLLLYLKEQTKIEEKKLRAIISYDLDDDADNPITDDEKQKIVDALEKVKILDPACGSGAFPIGALQKIVFILQQIDPQGKLWREKQFAKADPEFRKDIEKRFSNKEYDFIRKLGIIRDCIYGIDIQPIATEISRLRCFLTLIVDEQVDDEAENRGIKPLPNLDFKFVTANSLIGLPKIDEPQSSMFDDYQKIEELKKIRDEYFNASGLEREQLKTQFVSQQKLLFKDLQKEHGWQGVSKAELTNKLTDWDPFTHKSTPWFDPEWMFGIKEGFDIVIANPPYGANIDDLSSYFRKNYLEVIKNYSDIFKIFFSFGIKVLKKTGVLTYITPNVYLAQPRYKDLRIYLLKYALRKILNLGLEVFEGAVVPTCITLLQNSPNDEEYILSDASVNSKFKGDLNNLKVYQVTLKQVREMPDLSLFQTSQYKVDEIILDKIMELKDAGIQYHRSGIGLKNKGGNDLFERIVNPNPQFFSNSIPVWYGKLIKSYYLSPKSDEYFNLGYKDILKKNESVSFSKVAFEINEKIVWRQTAPYIIATVDKDRHWFRNTIQCGWIRIEYKEKIKLEYLLALLNSSYIRFFYQKIVNETSGRVFPQVKITHVKKLPIKLCEITQQDIFIAIVEKILNLTNSEDYLGNIDKQSQAKTYKKQIDQIVYKLYGLTPEEIQIVEKNL